MEPNKPQCALHVRPPYEVADDAGNTEESPREGADYSDQRDKDLREVHVLYTHGCADPKTDKGLRGCFAILLSELCALFSSLVAADSQQRVEGGHESEGRGALTKKDVEDPLPFPYKNVPGKGKESIILDIEDPLLFPYKPVPGKGTGSVTLDIEDPLLFPYKNVLEKGKESIILDIEDPLLFPYKNVLGKGKEPIILDIEDPLQFPYKSVPGKGRGSINLDIEDPLFPYKSVARKGKEFIMHDGRRLLQAMEKVQTLEKVFCRERANKGFPNIGKNGKGMFDSVEKWTLDEWWGAAGLFGRCQPDSVSAAVYPVHGQHSGRDARAGGGPQPRSPLSPAAADRWPPESMHGTPWSTFRQELYRLGTFLHLPHTFPASPLRLAQAGFLRLEDESIVCFFCGLVRNEWSSQESPLQVHRQLRPDCPLVTGLDCDNVGVEEARPADRLAQVLQTWSLQDRPGASPRSSMTDEAGNRPNNTDLSDDGASRTLEAGARAGPSSAAGGGSSGTVNRNVSGPGQQALQPPRMGLMGGGPASANPATPAILDGTAQPQPPPPRLPPAGSDPQPRQGSDGRQVVTFKQLGIITGAPKRRDMATVQSRLETFQGWPHSRLPTRLHLAEAGFYYAGYADCGRCFFCAGGLRSWDPVDDPWVAHARWFPSCGYVRQCQGQDFIDAVAELRAEGRSQITLAQVRQQVRARRGDDDPSSGVRNDPAVGSAVHAGFTQEAVETAARRILSEGQQLSVVRLIDCLEADGLQPEVTETTDTTAADTAAAPSISEDVLAASPATPTPAPASSAGEVDALQTENSDLRQRAVCKVCLDREVAVLFLPCGHLVTCAPCAPALRACPVCRLTIRGAVRVLPAICADH